MAPEQARGRAVDLSGTRAFDGEELSDVMASVLRQEIDWSALPPDAPPPLRDLLRRCLERDPKQRLRDIGEARIVLGKFVVVDAPHASGQRFELLTNRTRGR